MLQKELAKHLKARYDTKMDGSGWLEVSSDAIPPMPDKIQRSISKQYEFEKNSTKKLSELLNNTVDEIRLYTDKTVAVVLRNRLYIGKKEIYNGTDYICSSEKNSTNN